MKRQMSRVKENLDKALKGYYGESESPSNSELRDIGIDPEQNSSGAALRARRSRDSGWARRAARLTEI
ncbi:MAG: hypothetical protein J07HQW2_02544 [Haloquadratum walsbyi J07HQW2]|uniref:Uncharacterized protein n=1 Tax=Haloquadratum walsbyi J07HQW2 TaxID=1238425 RepID=U1PQN3_9EURY|nr:MAG: hypothetical protein J07HQW2_02544 [Haloquadratum walsbyi J07HQW2]